MKIDGSHLTYCTNIHRGESWREVRDNLEQYVAEVRRRVAPGRAFGMGLRLSGQAAHELEDERAFGELQRLLDTHDMYLFTLNGFPYGPFHGTRVKEGVYDPDWSHAERLAYSNSLARLLARLLPEGVEGTVSTVPLGWRPDRVRVEQMVEMLIAHVATLYEIEQKQGRRVVLALEPEPGCHVETTAQAIQFIEDRLLPWDARAELARRVGIAPQDAEHVLRAHVGVCLDTCHAAVEHEDAADAVRSLRDAGIRIAKVQLSAGLRVPEVDAGALEALEPFSEGVYLHQVVAGSSAHDLRRYDDLPEAMADARKGGEEWRVHFHVPLFAESVPPFASTRPFVEELLALHREKPVSPHLEIETYTWEVLPPEHRGSDVVTATCAELEWVLERLPP